MILIIQSIKVIWDKQARGGLLATKRNQVPDRQLLPITITDYQNRPDSALIHRIVYSFNFDRPICDELLTYQLDQLTNFGCIKFKYQQQQVTLTYHWYEELGGAPARTVIDRHGSRQPLDQKAFCLSLDQLGRIEYNGRFGDDHQWWYEQMTINAALVNKLDRDIFLTREFNYHYQQLADLW